jgi:hypothetical protein
LAEGNLHLGDAGGPVLTRASMPYPVPLDAAA